MRPNISDDRIRKCLDYLVKEYKNEFRENSDLLEFINLNVSGNLLNDRVRLLENIQNLQDLGKCFIYIKIFF